VRPSGVQGPHRPAAKKPMGNKGFLREVFKAFKARRHPSKLFRTLVTTTLNQPVHAITNGDDGKACASNRSGCSSHMTGRVRAVPLVIASQRGRAAIPEATTKTAAARTPEVSFINFS
jgi:hypothetical protein